MSRAGGRGDRLREGRDDVLVERFARCAGLFAAVEHGDRLRRHGHGVEQVGHRERPEQVHLHDAQLRAARVQELDRLARGLGARAHEDDHAVGVRGAEVVEQRVTAARELREPVHRRWTTAGTAA